MKNPNFNRFNMRAVKDRMKKDNAKVIELMEKIKENEILNITEEDKKYADYTMQLIKEINKKI